MYFGFLLFSVYYFSSQVSAIALTPDVASQAPANLSANTSINATIIDHAGHDITSSFQIRLYYPEATSNHTANQNLSARQAGMSRPINHCPGQDMFLRSSCTPKHNKPGSLQSYTLACLHTTVVIQGIEFDGESEDWPIFASRTGAVPEHQHRVRRRDGHCNEDEICVQGLGVARSSTGRRMASCVRTEFFVKYIKWGENEQSVDLAGKMASMVMSQSDGTTPVEVDTFEADGQTSGSGPAQTSQCRDCMELKTDKFGANTESLNLQTRLLTVGGMAGVLWLAIASG